MKKETIKTVVITTLILLVVLLSVKSMKCYQEARKQPKTVYLTDTIVNVEWDTVYLERYKTVKLPIADTTVKYITDTITNVLYDTVFFDHFETVKLPTTDTAVYYIADTVTRVDSIEVEVPISIYKLDTIFSTDTTSLNIRIRNSGYAVTLDTISYKFEYTPTLTKTNYFKEHFKFGVGVSSGYGVFSKKPDIFLGVGFYYCF